MNIQQIKRSKTVLDVISDLRVNHLNPDDAIKHHFTSLKTDLIFLQQRFLEQTFP